MGGSTSQPKQTYPISVKPAADAEITVTTEPKDKSPKQEVNEVTGVSDSSQARQDEEDDSAMDSIGEADDCEGGETREADESDSGDKELLEELSQITRELDQTINQPERPRTTLSKRTKPSKSPESGSPGSGSPAGSGRQPVTQLGDLEDQIFREHSHDRATSWSAPVESRAARAEPTGEPGGVLARDPDEWDIPVNEVDGFDIQKFKAANQKSGRASNGGLLSPING